MLTPLLLTQPSEPTTARCDNDQFRGYSFKEIPHTRFGGRLGRRKGTDGKGSTEGRIGLIFRGQIAIMGLRVREVDSAGWI